MSTLLQRGWAGPWPFTSVDLLWLFKASCYDLPLASGLFWHYSLINRALVFVVELTPVGHHRLRGHMKTLYESNHRVCYLPSSFLTLCWTTLTTAMADSLWWTHPEVCIYTSLSVIRVAHCLWWCRRVTLVDYIILGGCGQDFLRMLVQTCTMKVQSECFGIVYAQQTYVHYS